MVRINFVGDVALFNVFEEKGIDPFKEVILPDSDYNIGNFEFIIPKNREKYFFDVSNNYKIGYKYFKQLNLDIFSAFSLANNHCMDYGVDGANDVIAVLNEKGIANFGFGSKEFNLLKFTIQGISFAVLSFVKQGRWSRSNQQPIGPDSYKVGNIISEIKGLKQSHHHVIVFPHWGTELVDVPDPKDVIIARSFVDAGATAVIGHHPHIIQGIEIYNNGLIAYSLGSFIYVPEKESGFKSNQDKNRNYSICLNVSFDKGKILAFEDHSYLYNMKQLMPMPVKKEIISDYLKTINASIGDESLYKKRIREVLLKREIIAFFERFKESPFKTIKHYFGYIKIGHLKKILLK
ncbi:CapA family protein [Arenibacter palladensis]|uniref:CapA family protein n=1 Tax=Arenibacter palladensis TaxID=237373 RepID=UPI0026E22FC0|nr:CapA family protein [Arenibacter palladensis]MDO6604346.1 CapA family protein [Arenibacter palladensis]